MCVQVWHYTCVFNVSMTRRAIFVDLYCVCDVLCVSGWVDAGVLVYAFRDVVPCLWLVCRALCTVALELCERTFSSDTENVCLDDCRL